MTSAEIRERILQVQALLFAANETYAKLLAQDMHEYRFHSGEGTQWVIKRKLAELQKQIDYLELKLDGLNARLNGTGLVNFNLRRL